jgi:GAF domain-containing protein
VLDIDADERWPAWRAVALDSGFRSAAALPGVIDNETTAALNLYTEALDPWDREALLAVDALAQVVAEAIRHVGVVPGAPVLA